MCNSKRDAMATDPKPRIPASSSSGRSSPPTASSSFGTAGDSHFIIPSSSTTTSTYFLSLAGNIKDSLPTNPTFYSISELLSATNHFLSGRLSSSSPSPCWRCTVRGRDSVVSQLRFRSDPQRLGPRLASTCKIYHGSIARLLGGSLDGDYIYLVYDYVPGATLADCLRNPRDPHYTPLSNWLSRMQVAKDLADSLAYIHCYAGGGGTVHNRIKSSSVIITEPHLRPKICHVGAAVISGEVPDEISEEGNPTTKKRIEGTRGYMAPEILAEGSVSKKSDVFAFGVVLLELLSGEEPLKYTYDRRTDCYTSVSLVETAQAVMQSEEEEGNGEERAVRMRKWVDWRLRDSFPVDVAERLLRLALECVNAVAEERPDMARVAGKVSKWFLQSEKWAEQVKLPTEITVSIAPR